MNEKWKTGSDRGLAPRRYFESSISLTYRRVSCRRLSSSSSSSSTQRAMDRRNGLVRIVSQIPLLASFLAWMEVEPARSLARSSASSSIRTPAASRSLCHCRSQPAEPLALALARLLHVAGRERWSWNYGRGRAGGPAGQMEARRRPLMFIAGAAEAEAVIGQLTSGMPRARTYAPVSGGPPVPECLSPTPPPLSFGIKRKSRNNQRPDERFP